MSSTVRAEFSTSSGSSQPRGLPVSTAQNWHARVQTLPISMIVAVPLFQHSPMFGQIDSSHTVASRCSCTVARSCSKRSPAGMRALSHGGFGSRGACCRSARAFTPFLMAANPCSVWYFVPVVTTGMPRNSLIVLGNMLQMNAIEYRTPRKWGVMGRYRAPRPPSAKYITPEGAARLRRELDELWRVKRPAVTRAVSEAAAQGDRSENAEYIYGKKQLAEIDRRVRYLRKRLTGIRVVDQSPERYEQGVLRRVVRARRRRRPAQRVSARRPRRDRFRARLHQRRLAARPRRARQGSGRARSRCRRPTASGATSSRPFATAMKSQAKKSPAEAGRVTGGNR